MFYLQFVFCVWVFVTIKHRLIPYKNFGSVWFSALVFLTNRNNRLKSQIIDIDLYLTGSCVYIYDTHWVRFYIVVFILFLSLGMFFLAFYSHFSNHTLIHVNSRILYFRFGKFSGVRIMCKFVIFQNGPLCSNADTHRTYLCYCYFHIWQQWKMRYTAKESQIRALLIIIRWELVGE